MKLTRRDLLAWGGGAAAGAVLTPMPWTLLDGAARWTQNWPWIPQPPRGPVEVKTSFCTLCPHGCGMRVRMAGGCAVGVSGLPRHPVSRGALCPLAFGAHQLNWHPRRLRQVTHSGRAASWDRAIAAFRKACAEGPVAIVDGRPGRALSSLFAEFARRQGGVYAVAPIAEERALQPYAAWSGVPAGVLGYDLENAATVVSFAAPLLDGWGAPGRCARLWSRQDPAWRLIQIEPELSPTAACAGQWVRIARGSEAALAAGVARVLIEEGLVAARGPLPPATLADCAVRTGCSAESIRELARSVVAHGPAVAIAADAEPAVAALNVVLGAAGARGGIVRRGGPAPGGDALTGSFRAVLIDSSVDWEFAPPAGAEVFRFAAWSGAAKRADWLLPAPGFLEDATDIPASPASSRETYALAAKLMAPPVEVRSPGELLIQLDPGLRPAEERIDARCRAIFTAQAGTVERQDSVPVSGLASADQLIRELRAGAVWLGPPPRSGGLRCELAEWPPSAAPQRAPDWKAAWAPAVLPPLAAKLYRESNLRRPPRRSEI